jgi:amino acid transporter
MKKSRFWIVALMIALVVFLMAFAAPVAAQDGGTTDAVTTAVASTAPPWLSALGNFLLLLLTTIVGLLGVAITTERGTELVKTLLRKLATIFPKLGALAPNGMGSWLLALVAAGLVTFGFNLDFLKQFQTFQQLDPQMVQICSMILIWLTSNIIHPAMPKPAIQQKK